MDEIKPLTKEELAAELEQIRKIWNIDPSAKGDLEATRKILSKVSLSDGIILERRGGDMWEDLKKWLESFDIQFPIVNDKIREIEKEYGIG